MKRIGIMGGTFNPVHNGHIAIAKEAMDHFILDRVVFVPAGLPPHKTKAEIADKEDRYQMVKMAIAGRKNFYASRIEMDRPGYSYAVDTFREFYKEFGKQAKIFYIMGLDSINDILNWKKPLELFKFCEFVVATRPGNRIRTFKRLVKFPPLQREVDKIHLIEVNVNISATEIRERIKNGKSIEKMVGRQVAKYIEKEGLYK
ncbi:nicotinate (nicotinamide) nucleotide adenylyltransferase [candidate division WOR-1 bacterium RIFOXYA12_FULL_43_27]|uniref:Probable nicotinate-nucleotide adenylyltransferase n=1 Tax=candidate division WOR-1 bacterium RIFOXYC2_FULL_46_14 TaxID=1802587 RepID=A0A1F4U606_UNCSA|nr:MAG: nicotinate (nicotinamide) nucleotide adenylyltransferase [candidate division WOR-1 bacterium RIFOXYA12_FULL_43_27]OGC20556.1 MAG: nicotinate (nicotinamide) nucleotide adenylyltransferase [candidate division WOR-1 bacterium RIFOXYB2_FULL_46_45]OGC31707.1 MAG: nicotinate (nicotinamide) nucleotide adenylyltransferase [candidate division WOR-1 bacterium RIFOXYA2_FULL_46_56]OGC40398.1 MAG: nicotinate (nicotinamide) nucleotide adenylyltransferase [candidate division WOR-1 bacterium RIFOXYC2_FU